MRRSGPETDGEAADDDGEPAAKEGCGEAMTVSLRAGRVLPGDRPGGPSAYGLSAVLQRLLERVKRHSFRLLSGIPYREPIP